MIFEIAVGVLLALPLLYWYLTWNYNYWEKLGVPYKKPIPIFGNFLDSVAGRRNICEIQKEIYDEFEGYLYCGVFKLRQPALLMRDPKIIKMVMIENFSNFHDNDININEKTDPMFGKNPFVLNGERWRNSRRLLISSMSASRIKLMYPLVKNATNDLVEYLLNDPESKSKDGISSKEISAKYTTEVISAFVFGVDENVFRAPKTKCREMGRLIMDISYWNAFQHFIVLMYPKMADLLNFKFIKDEAARYFTFLMKQSVDFRQKTGFSRPDFLEYLINLRNKYGPEVITDDLMAAYTSTFFTDGFDTSSTGLCYALYECAQNPDMVQRLREEIDEVKAKHDGELTYEAIQEMEYLDRFVSEILRLYPPASYTMKLCTNDTTLPNPSGEGPDIPIKKGISLFLPIYALHLDPKYYPDPNKFNPDRFLPEEVANRPKQAYLPFGDGPRICLGFRLALIQMKTALAGIVDKLDVKLNKRTTTPLQVDPNFFLLAPKGGIWLNFEKRSQ